MYLKQHKPIHSQRGPSCLAMILFAGLLFTAGFLFANRGNIPDALDPILPDPTAIPTESPSNYALRGRIFERDGETEQAIGAWESAITADPENPTYYEQLAELYVEVRRPEEALELLETALDFAPEDDGLLQAKAGAHLAYGEWLVDHGEPGLQQYILAVSVGSNAASLNPNNARAYAYMAGGYVRQSNTEWVYALEPAAAAYDIAPEDPIVLYHTAEAVRFNGNVDLAVVRLEDALELDPDNARIALELAGTYRHPDIGRNGESITVLENVLEYDECNAAVLDRLAVYYIIAGASPLAERNAEEAIECDPTLIRAYAHLGHALFKQNNYERAEEALERAINSYTEVTSSNALYYALLGLTYYRQDEANCEKAIPLFNLAVDASVAGSAGQINGELGLNNCRGAIDR